MDNKKKYKRNKVQIKLALYFFLLIVFIVTIVSSVSAGSAKKNLELGNNAYKLGDYHQAIYYYQKSIAVNPSFEPALSKLAWSYYYNHAYKLSEKTFLKILKTDVKNIAALLGLAEIEKNKPNYAKALSLLEKARKISPYNLEVKLLIAKVYEDAGKTRIADLKFREILKSNPEYFQALLGFARVNSEKKKYSKALSLVDKAIKIRPHDPEAYMQRGRILLGRYFSAKNEEEKSDYLLEAKTAFFTSHSIKDNLLESNLILARLNYAEKQYDSALAFIEKAISLNPDNARFASFKAEVLGSMLTNTGNISIREKVLKSYARAIELDPFDDIGRYSYEDILLKYIEKGMHPYRLKAARYHYKKAKQDLKENKNRRALLELKRAIKLYPGFIPARVSYLNYLYYSGDMEGYIHGLKYLRRSFPKEERYYNALEWALNHQHKQMYYKAGLYRQNDGDYNYRRTETRVFVFSLKSSALFPPHPSAGKVISKRINFALNDIGRLKGYSQQERNKIFDSMSSFISEKEFSFSNYKTIFYPEVIKVFFTQLPKVKRPHYLLYGDYKQGQDSILGNFIVYNLKKGVVVSNFSLSAKGEGALNSLALRASRRLYNSLPYHGLLIKKTEKFVYLNLGRRDGIKKSNVFALAHNGEVYAHAEIIQVSERISKAIVYKIKRKKNKKVKFSLSAVRLYDKVSALHNSKKITVDTE